MDQQWGGGGQPTQQSDRFYYQPQPQPQEQEHMLPPTDQSNMPQMPIQTGKNYRPFVDPEAQGVVDATSYPEPKESTHKIRGKSDILEKLFNNVSQELLMAKTFYFFFFSAFGSLFPLMAVYFKQLGMNPGQTGVLIGCRPFVEFVAAPFWGKMAERWQKGKLMLLCSVGAWIVFTLSLSFAQPPAASCIFYNGSSYILTEPYTNNREKRDLSPSEYFDGNFMSSSEDFGSSSENFVSNVGKLDSSDENFSLNTEKLTRRKRESDKYALPPDHVVGKSPSVVHYTVNYKQYGKDETLLSPPFSRNVFRESDVQKVFFLLLLLVLLGEFFSCPAIALADTAVLTFLGDDADQYGSQRMFGSLGWGLAMFFVGIALDNSTSFPNHPCKAHLQEKNYTICFAVFSVLMGCALMTATQFKFQMNEAASNVIPMEEVKEPVDTGPRPWNEPKIPMQQTKTGKEQFEEAIGNIKTRIFANTMREMPEWMVVFREFKTLRCGTFLFVAWWMGFGIGLIFGFLFWHLQIEAYIKELKSTEKLNITTESIGKTHEKRCIHMVTIKSAIQQPNQTFFIEGGIHAREWISIAVTLYIIDQLTKKPELIKNIEFKIVPVANPDGYYFSHKDDRFWRKNRRPHALGLVFDSCNGVDLNRNWNYHFGGKSHTSNKCSEIYGGNEGFSEPETKALSRAILNSENVTQYLSFHSYGQWILYPWAHTETDVPNLLYILNVAGKWSDRVKNVHEKNYRLLNPTKMFGPVSGSSLDWVYGVVKSKLALTVELRDVGQYGFLLPPEQIQPTCEEMWEGFTYLLEEM